jgi:hypothetical protein
VNPGFDVLLYALLAAASPLALAAVLVVLRSGRGRLNGTGFAVGVVVGQTVVYLLVFVIGVASVHARAGGHPTLQSTLELAFGIALIVVAFERRFAPPRPRRDAGPRTRALMSRLERLRPLEALGAGLLLGIGGPKRLLITVLAAATISTSGLGRQGKVAASVAYVVLATVLVWAPVVVYVVLGDRAGDRMVTARTWLTAHRARLTFPLLVALGLFFVADAVIRLV